MNKSIIISLVLISAIALNSIPVFGQQNPTGTSGISNDWRRGGNLSGAGTANSNIFGTFWNSPIYAYTAGVNRTRLNGNLFTPICNTPGIDVSGFFGIGLNSYFANESP